jgi:hypothetical protein
MRVSLYDVTNLLAEVGGSGGVSVSLRFVATFFAVSRRATVGGLSAVAAVVDNVKGGRFSLPFPTLFPRDFFP